MHHGNLEVSSELRLQDDGEPFFEEIQKRQSMPPYNQRRVHVEASFTRERGEFTIRDQGPGFDPDSLPDPTDPANLDKPSGRGIAMMRFIMDEVNFNVEGNVVTMAKAKDNDEEVEFVVGEGA